MKEIFSWVGQYLKRMDKILLIVCVACGLFSVVLLHSIMVNDASIGGISTSKYKVQLVAVALGAATAMVLSALDYRKLAKLWFLYVPLGLIPCLLVFVLGYGRAGADDLNWLDLGFISIQPSEILKIAFIMSFAYHLSKVGDHMNRPASLLLLMLHGAVPTLLITLQGDYGTVIVFVMIFFVMLFFAGLSWKYILAAAIALPPAGLFVWFKVLQPVHKKRVLVVLDPSLDPNIAWQQQTGQIALGSGQLFGKGLYGGEYSRVSEVWNDFIFSYVGQTTGFVGCMILVGALCYICLKILANSRIAKDTLGRNICMGAFALIFTHVFMNIGMVLGVMPVIGIPLPFTSGGGTAMVSMFVVIGLVMSTYSHSTKHYALFYDPD